MTSSDDPRQTASDLLPLLYDQLRRIASRYMKQERLDHTLQPTALVHEAYLRLTRQPGVQFESRAHFLGIAAHLMRQILVDHARKHVASKRGGRQEKIELKEYVTFAPSEPADVVALHEALLRFEKLDPRRARVVELRFFAGLTVEETAEVLDIAPRTVKEDWRIARIWLHGVVAEGD